MKLLNCTPHAIVLHGGETFQPSGILPRVSTTQVEVEMPFPCVKTVFGDIEGLPEFEEGTYLIVSGMVLAANAGRRSDLVAPDTSLASAIRNEAGHVVAVRRFTV